MREMTSQQCQHILTSDKWLLWSDAFIMHLQLHQDFWILPWSEFSIIAERFFGPDQKPSRTWRGMFESNVVEEFRSKARAKRNIPIQIYKFVDVPSVRKMDFIL